MKTKDETRWSRWAGKLCTAGLWLTGIGFGLGTIVFVWILLGDPNTVATFLKKPGRVNLGFNVQSHPLDLARVDSIAGLRLIVSSFFLLVSIYMAGLLLVLSRLRRLLAEVEENHPFPERSVKDLSLIGSLLLSASVAGLLLTPVFQWVASSVIPGLSIQFDLLPDLTLLLCGLLVRALAVIFAHGVRLQQDADLTA